MQSARAQKQVFSAWAPFGSPLGGLLGASWGPLGGFLEPLGGLLGASWGPLGGLLEASREPLGGLLGGGPEPEPHQSRRRAKLGPWSPLPGPLKRHGFLRPEGYFC